MPCSLSAFQRAVTRVASMSRLSIQSCLPLPADNCRLSASCFGPVRAASVPCSSSLHLHSQAASIEAVPQSHQPPPRQGLIQQSMTAWHEARTLQDWGMAGRPGC